MQFCIFLQLNFMRFHNEDFSLLKNLIVRNFIVKKSLFLQA